MNAYATEQTALEQTTATCLTNTTEILSLWALSPTEHGLESYRVKENNLKGHTALSILCYITT